MPFKDKIVKSLESTKCLLSDVISRLQLKRKNFKVFKSNSSDDIDNFWEVLQLVDPLLIRKDTRKKDIEGKQGLKASYDHCCHSRHYFFFN